MVISRGRTRTLLDKHKLLSVLKTELYVTVTSIDFMEELMNFKVLNFEDVHIGGRLLFFHQITSIIKLQRTLLCFELKDQNFDFMILN